MNFQEAIETLTENAKYLPHERVIPQIDAIKRVRRTSHHRRASAKAIPMTPELRAEVRQMRRDDPDIRIADIAEKTGCAFHDISVFLNGSKP